MPAPLPADWAGMRLLAAQGHTLQEIAQMHGISLNTICARSAREGWKEDVRAAQELRKERAISVAVSSGQMQERARSTLDVVQEELANGARETRLGLTKYAARMAKQADETGVLEEAPLYKAVADIHGKMHPETSQTGPTLNLLVMGGLDAE